jgi:glycine/D-amino acid oxidase-like deaminating enzyme
LAGFSGHGFGIGPGAGKLMAEIVTGAPTCVDARPFRLDRFKRAKAANTERALGTRLAHQ